MATNRSKVGTSTESLMHSTPFVGGLNTELSGIIDSTEFTKDELNMMIRPDGTRSRRPGVDYEEMYSFGEQAFADVNDPKWAFEAIEWYDVAGPDEAVGYDGQPYIVVQNGSALQFFLNKGQPYSGNESEFALNLLDYKLDGKSDKDVAEARCKFATAYGSLFVCSDAIRPIQLRSAQTQLQPSPVPASTSASVRISTKVRTGHRSRLRSFYESAQGSRDGFWVEFYFNGVMIKSVSCKDWYGSPYTSDDGGPWFFCSTQIAQMWNSIPSETRLGITATPKYANAVPWKRGIEDLNTGTIHGSEWDSLGPDDWVTFTAPVDTAFEYRGYTIEMRCYAWGSKYPGSYAWIQKGTLGGGTAYTNETGYSLMIRDTSVGAKDFLAIQTSPSKMSYAHLYNLYNQGWTNKLLAKYYTNPDPSISGTFPANNLAQQYLKDDKTTAFKPEALLNTTFGNTPAARGHAILNYFNQQRRTSLNVVAGMVDLVQAINDLGVSVTLDGIRDKLGSTAITEEAIAAEQVPDYKTTYQHVTDLIHYAGRLFYLVGDTLLYSQMISEDTTKAGYCYTEADPTSEEISDVVETDGGLISLPDLGEGIKLAQVGQYLLVFGTRGNVAITGTANNIFTATAYSAGSLNAVPSQAPQSFVNTEFGLLYWGTTGITFIANANEGLAVQDLSTPKILTWYGQLNNTQHKYCKGVYSSSKKKVYWFYPSDEEKPCRLDCCLVYDLQRNSFAPQKIATDVESTDDTEMVYTAAPEIVSGLSLKTPFRADREYPIEGESDRIDVSASPYLIWNEPAYHAGSDFPVVYKNTETWHSTPEAGFTVEYEGQHVLTSGSSNEGNIYILDTITASGGISTQTVNTYCEYKGVLRPFSTATVIITQGVPPAVYLNIPGYTMYAGYCSAENTEGDSTTLSDVYIIDKEAKAGDKFYMIIDNKVREVGYITQAGYFRQEGKDYEQNGVLNYFKGYFTDSTIPDPNAFADDVYISTDVEVTWDVRISGYEPGSVIPNFVTYEVPDRTSRVYLQTRENKVLEVTPYAGEVIISQDNPVKVLADDPISSEAFTYESSILVCLDVNNSKITFGDFRNNNMRDWTAGDWQGPGYIFDSYLISHPMNANGYSQFSGNRKSDIVHSKNMPYLLSYFRRTETGPLIGGGYVYPSACQGSILWDWRTSGRAGKWSSPTDLYRPYKDTIFDNGFIVNKTNIRGLGRAYQVKLESVEDNQFILEGLVFDLKNDGRI